MYIEKNRKLYNNHIWGDDVLDFKQIEAFINVARFKSFSKAAEAVYLSQPTISTHINTLEGELGINLFDRSSKDVQLTPAGLLFYDYAINMVNIRDQAVHSISEFYDKIDGELTIASSTTPCHSILLEIIYKFSRKFPNVNFKIFEMSSSEVISKILNFDAEIGIVGRKTLNDKLIYTEFRDDNLVLVTPVNTKYDRFENNYVEFKDIQSEPFILREPTSATRQVFEEALGLRGIDINKIKIFAEVNNMEAALHLVKLGLGVSVVSENAAREYICSNSLRKFYIKDLTLYRKIYTVNYGRRTLSPAAVAFQNFMFTYSKQ